MADFNPRKFLEQHVRATAAAAQRINSTGYKFTEKQQADLNQLLADAADVLDERDVSSWLTAIGAST